MLRISLLLILLTHTIAYITDSPSLAAKLDRLYEKLEKITIPPAKEFESSKDMLYAKLDKLNSIVPEKVDLSDDDEELLSALQLWGVNDEQLLGVVKEIQLMKDEKTDKMLDGEYADGEWVDDDFDYANDANEEWADIDPEGSTPKTAVTPSAYTKDDPADQAVSVVDILAATNERPRIVEVVTAPLSHSSNILSRAALTHIRSVLRSSECRLPQARWFPVSQLAPAADISYMPQCVQLHRCSPDAGCCQNEADVCAPVEGKNIILPFILKRADGTFNAASMLFFNHTRCACVPRDTLQASARDSQTNARVRDSIDVRTPSRVLAMQPAREPEWRATEEPRIRSTEEPKLAVSSDDEPTAPPQMRRCTCPTLFLAHITDGNCSCGCDWADFIRRRDCLSLAKGREHFGLKDRVCVANGDCNTPTCEYGAYDKTYGRCPQNPQRRYRRMRFFKGRYQAQSIG